MIKVYFVFLLLLFLGTTLGFSQEATSTSLSYEEYLEYVATYHPVARQANRLSEFADAKMLEARGGFDPQLKGGLDEKNFDDKDYYRILQTGLQIPSWYGLTASAGFENTSGVFLNPENTTTGSGLWSLGVEANLLQGLRIDERRAALQQAKVVAEVAENDKRIFLNQLLHTAGKAYLNWQNVTANKTVLEQSILLAEEYFEATRLSFINGDKPAIDTLEAMLIIQDGQAALQKNEAELVKTRQMVENYLWYENNTPLELQPTTRPASLKSNTLLSVDLNTMDQLLAAHPELIDKELKNQELEIDLQLNKEKLKPKLKVKYNPLIATTDNSLAPDYTVSNYKWGVSLSSSLFRRSERAKVQENKLKIQFNQLDIENKRNRIKNKIEATLELQDVIQKQLEIQEQFVQNYQTLLEAEREKFSYGESSVFLLNKRQEKFIESQLKLNNLLIKLEETTLDYLLESGTLANTITPIQ